MSNEVEIRLVSMECESAIGDATDVPEMLKLAFSAAKKHWMVLDKDPQLKGALNATLTKLKGRPEFERLEKEIELLAQFNAFLSAAQMGLNPEVPEIPEGFEPYGIMKLWQEAA
jgi:hypothetical protein